MAGCTSSKTTNNMLLSTNIMISLWNVYINDQMDIYFLFSNMNHKSIPKFQINGQTHKCQKLFCCLNNFCSIFLLILEMEYKEPKHMDLMTFQTFHLRNICMVDENSIEVRNSYKRTTSRFAVFILQLTPKLDLVLAYMSTTLLL